MTTGPSFASKYQDVGNGRLTMEATGRGIAAVQNVCHFSLRRLSARLWPIQQGGSTYVDLALKLNVLAVFAVFAFVGLILFGAF